METNNNNKKEVEKTPEGNLPHISKFSVEEPNHKEKKKYILPLAIGVIAAVLVFALVWIFVLKKTPLTNRGQDQAQGPLDPDNMVVNPITGAEVSKEQAENWKNVRPLAVMVNNHIDARPQTGLIDADFVFEVVAEGGITRFIAFYLNETPEKIGPVRSTREYYLVLVKEMGDAMIMHIGWSPQALDAIQNWPVRSLGRGGANFWRENPDGVATEHTAYVNAVELRELGDRLGWGGNREFEVWQFNDSPDKYAEAPEATELTIDFWYEGDYSANFRYNAENREYLRFMGYDADGNPVPHIDRETGEQLTAKNVIVQFANEEPIPGDDKSRLEYELVGSGSALVFIDGRVVEATWTKEGRDARTKFYDLDGEEIRFNRGKFWISIVPDRNVEQVVFN